MCLCARILSSLGGCRLLSNQELAAGSVVKLAIPAEVGGGKAFSVKGRVLRQLEQAAGDPAYAVKFEKPSRPQCEHLQRAIACHASGPARLVAEAKPPATEAPAEPVLPSPAAPDSAPPQQEAGVPSTASAAERAAAAAATPLPEPPDNVPAAPEEPPSDAALAQEADRVLMGREISLSGMRVDPSPLLGVGDDVRLAIHAGYQEQPLVVTAKVHRDDGDRGVVLRFHQLDPVATRQLDAVLDELPLIEPSRRDPGAGDNR